MKYKIAIGFPRAAEQVNNSNVEMQINTEIKSHENGHNKFIGAANYLYLKNAETFIFNPLLNINNIFMLLK